jgi:hypothetical protein
MSQVIRAPAARARSNSPPQPNVSSSGCGATTIT